ncbi:hypothetical protein CALCODRAFT_510352 [Calocera cornea HHB12733]|uniref:DUF6532 domain-containing protein n=1 Tax=Calocera cornea HHB12733 TaxID=1353952 RepID=A0A165EJX7_9BASI|nr:hypothetical protein CALCODRAFT_510352 [Calocera cornea HHB12733]
MPSKSITKCIEALIIPNGGSTATTEVLQEVTSIIVGHNEPPIGPPDNAGSASAHSSTDITWGGNDAVSRPSVSSALTPANASTFGEQLEGGTQRNKRQRRVSSQPVAFSLDDSRSDKKRKRRRIDPEISIGTEQPRSLRRLYTASPSSNSSESVFAYPLSSLDPVGENLSSYKPTMQITLQSAKKWYRIRLLTNGMYGRQEEADEADLSESADAANQEAMRAIPPHPIRNTKYWLRGRFKTKAQNLICGAYPDVFKLHSEAKTIQLQLTRESNEKRKKHFEKQLLKKQHQLSTGITTLLQDGRFLYQNYNCLVTDSPCSGLFLHDAIKELMAAMCYSKSPGCGDAARHPDYFDPPPAPLIAFSSAITGVLKPRNLDVQVEAVYFEMLGLLDEYAALYPKAFQDGMAELSQFCFNLWESMTLVDALSSVSRAPRDAPIQGLSVRALARSSESSEDGDHQETPEKTGTTTSATTRKRRLHTKRGTRSGSVYLSSVAQSTQGAKDFEPPYQQGPGRQKTALEALLGLSPSQLEQRGFVEEADGPQFIPLTELQKKRIMAWQQETAVQLGARLAVEQAARLDTSATDPLPLIDYRDEEEEIAWPELKIVADDRGNPTASEDHLAAISSRGSNSQYRGSLVEQYSRPISLERILRQYQAQDRRVRGASRTTSQSSLDKEKNATQHIDTELPTKSLIPVPPRTKLEKFYFSLDMKDVQIDAIPRRKEGEVRKKRKRKATSSRAAIPKTNKRRKSKDTQLPLNRQVLSTPRSIEPAVTARNKTSSGKSLDTIDRSLQIMPQKKPLYQLQAYTRPLRLTLQKSKGILHVLVGFLHAYPNRALLGNFVIKAAVAANAEVRKQVSESTVHTKGEANAPIDSNDRSDAELDSNFGTQEGNNKDQKEKEEREADNGEEDEEDDQDYDHEGQEQEVDDQEGSQNDKWEGSSISDEPAAEVDFKRYPHAFWVIKDTAWWIRSVMKTKARLLVQMHWAEALSGPPRLVKERVKRLLARGNFCQQIFDPMEPESKPKNAFRNPILSWLIALVYCAPTGGSSEAFKYRKMFSEATPFIIAFAATTIHHILESYTSGAQKNLRINTRVERDNYFLYLGRLASYEKAKPTRYEKLLVEFGAAYQNPKTLSDARNVCIGRHNAVDSTPDDDEMPFNSDEE